MTEWHTVRQRVNAPLGNRRGGNTHVLGMAAVERDAERSVVGAHIRQAADAHIALPAAEVWCNADPLSFAEQSYLLACLNNDPGEFVSQHDFLIRCEFTVSVANDPHVGTANARCHNLDQQFIITDCGNRHVFDAKTAVLCISCRNHCSLLRTS